jgi:CheY-like chemotaxis protein
MTLKLLVADDSPTIQKIVRLAFSVEDAMIETVSSGDAALESVQAFKPDVVLADVFMPGCSGYEVCAHIKENPELAGTPVILLVGTFEPFDESEATRVKCDGHITKPFDTSELIETVRSLVGDKMMPQNGESSAYASDEDVAQPTVPPESKLDYSNVKGLVSSRAWDSFLGSMRVLELFDDETLAEASTKSSTQSARAAGKALKLIFGTKAFEADNKLSEDFLNLIVDRVVRRMSSDVIREVAWEVVPELSEVLVRRVIEEQNKSRP